jgi:hypothetical protein
VKRPSMMRWFQTSDFEITALKDTVLHGLRPFNLKMTKANFKTDNFGIGSIFKIPGVL